MKLRTFFIAFFSLLVVGTVLGINLWVLSDPHYDGKSPQGIRLIIQRAGQKLRTAITTHPAVRNRLKARFDNRDGT